MSADLERDLRALGDRLAWPQTPDVAARLDLAPVPARERRGRRRLAVALAALAVTVPAGVAFGDDVLEWLGLRSVTVERRDVPPEARRPAPNELGEAVTLAEAERRAGFTPITPRALGTPREVRLDGAVVTLVYAGDVRLAQLPGALDRDLLRKIAPEVERLPDGLFFAGDHAYLYRAPDGDVAEDRPRLAGPTFVTARGDVLLRLEAPRLTPARARALLR